MKSKPVLFGHTYKEVKCTELLIKIMLEQAGINIIMGVHQQTTHQPK